MTFLQNGLENFAGRISSDFLECSCFNYDINGHLFSCNKPASHVDLWIYEGSIVDSYPVCEHHRRPPDTHSEQVSLNEFNVLKVLYG